MQIDYRPVPAAILASLSVLAALLIAGPIWYFTHWGAPSGLYAGKVIISPLAGLFWLFVVAMAVRRNRSYRVDPTVLNWNSDALTLCQRGRRQSFAWRDVVGVQVVSSGKRASPGAIAITVRDERTGTRRLRFDGPRLQLRGQRLADVAALLEAARTGKAAGPWSGSARTAGSPSPAPTASSGWSARGRGGERSAR